MRLKLLKLLHYMFNKFCSRESSTKWENGQTDQQCLNLFKETKYLLVIDLSFKEGLKTTVWGHVFKPWPPPTPTYVDIKEKKHYFRAFCQFSVLQQCKKPLIWLILLLLLSLLVSVPVLKKRIRIFWKNSDGSTTRLLLLVLLFLLLVLFFKYSSCSRG